MHWKYIVKSYKTKLISQARRQVAMLKICVALNKERLLEYSTHRVENLLSQKAIKI